MPLTPSQVPYTGPYTLPTGDGKAKGPTAEALKRAMSRMGAPQLPWTDFDQHYNQKLEDALDWWDPGKNGYGEGRWKKVRAAIIPAGRQHAGQFALDRYSQTLIQDEAKVTSTSTREARVQGFITEFWTIAIAHAGIWHYDMDRPLKAVVDPAAGGQSDCSMMVIQAHNYAKRKAQVNVPDPSKQNYSGYGNTDQWEDDWPRVGSPYRVGDLAHFHSERHVIECIAPGDVRTAKWGSNGREAAPELINSLSGYSRFPSEFICVVRPTLVA
jgi:hypothetical protein